MARLHENVKLSEQDCKKILELCSSGRYSARMVKRAMMLKLNHEGETVGKISTLLGCHKHTIYQVRNRYKEKGLGYAIGEKPRPGAPQKIDQKIEACITGIACSEPPSGRSRWTINLIADKYVLMEDSTPICMESIRTILKKVSLNHGKKNIGVLVE